MFLKKTISVILCLAIVLSASVAFANEDTMSLSCPSALLMDFSTGKVLYEKDVHSKRPMASVTKIMTMLLAMEAIDAGQINYDDMVTGSSYAKSMGGSTIFLDEGEQLSVRDILKGIAVSSGNDAAVAMGEHLSGSSENFVAMMNNRAKELGMNNTNFVNCNGLDDDNHYSTAYDIALMSRELMKHKDIFDFTSIWMDSLRNGAFTLSNTNKLIRFYDGATGLKTGSTSKAKFCISATAKRGDMHLIAVIMAAPSSKERSKDASALLNYGFSNYSVSKAVKKDEIVDSVHIDKGCDDSVNIICKDDVDYLYSKKNAPQLQREIVVSDNLCAPCKKGDKAGEIIIKDGEKEVGRCDLVFEKDVDKKNVGSIFSSIFKNWISL